MAAVFVSTALVVEQQVAHANGKQGIWDAVVATLVRAATDAYSRALPPEDHHTIPIYLCGASSQTTSKIAWRDHKLIHIGLARIWVGIAIAEEVADKMVPFGRKRNPEIMRFAETSSGRGVIAALIQEFYEETQYMEIGTPTIRYAFKIEKEPYVSGAKTSIPSCVRPK